MNTHSLNKEKIVAESSYAKYVQRKSGKYPKGVITLNEAKASDEVKVIFSKYHGFVFFTDDYTFGVNSLSSLSRQSTKLPYSVVKRVQPKNVSFKISMELPVNKLSPTKIISTHEDFLKEYFKDFQLIETVDDLITTLKKGQ